MRLVQTLFLAFAGTAASAAGLTSLEFVNSGGRDGPGGFAIFYLFALFFVVAPVCLATFAAALLAGGVRRFRGGDGALALVLFQGVLAAFCYRWWVGDSAAFGSPGQVLLSALTVGLCAASTSWLCGTRIRT